MPGDDVYMLPDDDSGRDDAYLMICHLAGCPNATPRTRQSWLAAFAPWLIAIERDRLLRRRVLKWSADKLAWRLRLAYADRQRLGIKTIGAIDMNAAERLTLRLAVSASAAWRKAQNRVPFGRPRTALAGQSRGRLRAFPAERGIGAAMWHRSVSNIEEAMLLLRTHLCHRASRTSRRSRQAQHDAQSQSQAEAACHVVYG
jgi:hypothetical protein